MRRIILAASLVALTTACASGNSGFDRKRPDELAVSRSAPLVVPPDFALVPPKPGTPRPQEADSSTQTLQALFGGAAVRSAVESGALSKAGGNRSQVGIRSQVGDPGTDVVDKGSTTRDIIAAPEGDGADASASTPK